MTDVFAELRAELESIDARIVDVFPGDDATPEKIAEQIIGVIQELKTGAAQCVS